MDFLITAAVAILIGAAVVEHRKLLLFPPVATLLSLLTTLR